MATSNTKHTNQPEKKDPVFCEICGQTCQNLGTLRLHMRAKHKDVEYKISVETGIRDWICDVCGSDFATAQELKSHFKRVHEGHKRKQYRCDICGSSCTSKSVLIKHLLEAHELHEK